MKEQRNKRTTGGASRLWGNWRLLVMAAAWMLCMLCMTNGLTARAATQLAAPTNLYLDDNFIGHFTMTDSADYRVSAELYNEAGEVIMSLSLRKGSGEQNMPFYYVIDESGTYYFVAYAYAADTEHTSSESVTSESKTYVKPSAQLGTVTAKWDSSNPGTISWNALDGAVIYGVIVYKYDDSTQTWTRKGGTNTKGTTADLSRYISDAGQYCVKIKAVSADITKIANGAWSDYSDIYDTSTGSVIESTDSSASDTTSTSTTNGLALASDGNWYYYANGSVDTSYTGMACNEYGWWYITNGALDWNYTGMACNEYGWWYMTNGALDWTYTGMACNDYGWWYMTNGALDWNYTGMACNDYGWWYFTNGALDWNYTGMACNEYGWWYITNGALDWGYTGLALNDYGWWYMTNGALDWNYTGMALNDYGWWYVTNGALDWGYTGTAQNEYGTWQFVNGIFAGAA